jgi:L-fuculose-phosphate aldolase
MNENVLREGLIVTARAMLDKGLNTGTSGNVSVRCNRGFLITPTGRSGEDCRPEEMSLMAMDGSWQGICAPSSEWRIHRDLYAARPEAGAILHAHSPFATALACQGRDIPAFHYMIARFGGADIRCAPYATFGTQALSSNAITALEGRNACLLANHGMIVFGRDLRHTLALALEFETLCQQYYRTCLLGAPQILDDSQMAEVIQRFSTYGQS